VSERWGQERKGRRTNGRTEGVDGDYCGKKEEGEGGMGEGERTLGGGGWVGFLFWRSDEAGECMDGFAAAAGTASFF